MNIKDLPQGSYTVNPPKLNVNSLPKGSYTVGAPTTTKNQDTGPQGFWSKLGSGIGSIAGKAASAIGNFEAGGAKGVESTVTNAGKLGSSALSQTAGRIGNLATGQGFTQSSAPGQQQVEQNVQQFISPQGSAQKFGFGTEQVAEFLAPAGVEEKAVSLADKGVEGLDILGKSLPETSKLVARMGSAAEGILKAASRSIVGATSAAGVTAAQGGTQGQIETNAGFAAALPIVGKAFGSFAGKAADKIETSLLKPTQSALDDGFKVENVFKYKVGGSLEDTIAKTNQKMNDLSKQLTDKLAGSSARVDIASVISKVEEDVSKNKPSMFGLVNATNSALEKMKAEVTATLGKETSVDLPTAQTIKRAAGSLGSWVNGHVDAEGKASEQLYSKFYSTLKTEIEKNAPPGVQAINRQISELIPISNAAIRRLPIAQRNAALSLTDAIGLFSSVGHPGVLPLEVANFLSKRGGTAEVLNMAAAPTTAVGKKIFGR